MTDSAVSVWAIRCPWGAVFALTEEKAHEIADTYDRCCGCRRGLGPAPGSHQIEHGTGNPGANAWKAIEVVPRRRTFSEMVPCGVCGRTDVVTELRDRRWVCSACVGMPLSGAYEEETDK